MSIDKEYLRKVMGNGDEMWYVSIIENEELKKHLCVVTTIEKPEGHADLMSEKWKIASPFKVTYKLRAKGSNVSLVEIEKEIIRETNKKPNRFDSLVKGELPSHRFYQIETVEAINIIEELVGKRGDTSGIGYVYILENPVMSGVVKIGYTNRRPKDRAEELSSGTSVPKEFEVVYKVRVKNPKEKEEEIHSVLSEYRVDEDREFFRVGKGKAISAIEEII